MREKPRYGKERRCKIELRKPRVEWRRAREGKAWIIKKNSNLKIKKNCTIKQGAFKKN